MNNSHPRFQKFWADCWKKRWLRICIYLTALLLVFLLALPHALRIGLQHWLLNNGADEATINKLELNLFTGTAALKGVNVTLKGKTVLANSDIFFNLGLAALFSHQTFIQSATLHRVILDIEQYEDGRWRYGSYTTQPGDATDELVEDADESWIFTARQIDLSDCRIRYTQPHLETSLFIEKAQLIGFSTDAADVSGTLNLKGLINNAPILLKMDSLRIAPELDLGGSITTSGLQLDDLADLLSDHFNPFTGTAGIKGEFNFVLAQDHSVQVNYDGSIDLDESDIRGSGYATGGKNISWNGPVSYQQSPNSTMTINLDGELRGNDFSLDLPDQEIQIAQGSFALKNSVAVNIDQHVTVESDGTIDLGNTEYTIPAYRIQNKILSWEGKTSYTSARKHVDIGGSLTLEELGFEQPGPGQKYSLAELTLTGDIALPLDTPKSLEGKAGLEAGGLVLKSSDTEHHLVSLGHLGVEKLHAAQGQPLRIDGASIAQLKIKHPENALAISIPAVTLNKISSEDLKTFSVENISATSLQAINSTEQQPLATIGSLTITDLNADDSLHVSAESLMVDKASFVEQVMEEEKNDFLKFGRVTVNKPAWQENKTLNIADINLEDTRVTLLKGKTGQLLFMQELQKLQKEPPEKQPAETDPKEDKGESSAFTLQIGTISATGDSILHFEDHTPAVPFVADLTLEKLNVTHLDSTRPDQVASYEMAGNLDKYAPVNITGTLKPYGAEFSLTQALTLKNYPLTLIAPYSAQYLGIVPTQGTVSAETKLSIEKDHIDLQKEWLIKKIEIKNVDEKLASEFNSQLPLPLDAALSMLKDKHDNIELSMPISGTKDDLDFGIADLLITPLSKAIIKTTSSYLLYTLGPYGALAYVGMKAGEKIMETRVPPVVFEPGQTELTEEHKKYLERIAEILANRPGLDLQLCAWVLPREHLAPASDKEKADTPAKEYALSDEDKKTLLNLGNTRAIAIKDHLVLEHDIEPGRLILCLPEVDKGKNAKSRVELEV